MYRHELKFLITNVDKTELRNVLQHFCHHDRHAIDGFYSISSLYFDDMYHTAYQEKLDGVEIRKKYRIRIYNCSDSVISLECKYKNGQYIHKESVRLTRDEYDSILEGNVSFLLEKKEPLAKEFYVDYKTALLRPCVNVVYEREPFIYDAGTVRITFDENIRAARCTDDLFDPSAPSWAVLPSGQLVLEVKFTGLLPERIRTIFLKYGYVQSQASKFCMCLEKVNGLLR